jgi:hypothetical protein
VTYTRTVVSERLFIKHKYECLLGVNGRRKPENKTNANEFYQV